MKIMTLFFCCSSSLIVRKLLHIWHLCCHLYFFMFLGRTMLLDCSISWLSSFIFLLAPALVAQLDAPSDWRPGGCGFNPRRGRQHSSVEIDHEIFSTIILSHPLIQEGQLSVSGERMCTILINRLED